MVIEAIERLGVLASLPLASIGQREGGEKTQPEASFAFASDWSLKVCYDRSLANAKLASGNRFPSCLGSLQGHTSGGEPGFD